MRPRQPLSIEQFVEKLRADIDGFDVAYRKKAVENPEDYPLVMPENNSGLWLEFFEIYMQTGRV